MIKMTTVVVIILCAASAKAQSISSIQIGDSRSVADFLGDPDVEQPVGRYHAEKWGLKNGNDFSITASPEKAIVYEELDWGGTREGSASQLSDFVFYKTSLADIVNMYKSRGISFNKRSSVGEISGDLVFLNSYKSINDTFITFITKINSTGREIIKRKGESAVDLNSRLVAIILCSKSYAATFWGDLEE